MRILAIDLGIKSVGLAISGPLKILQPLKSISRVNIFEELRSIIDIYSVGLIVVGLPLTLDGEKGEMARNAKKFAAKIEEQFGIKTKLVDERLTSDEAKLILKKKVIKGDKDSISALLILERYLEEESD